MSHKEGQKYGKASHRVDRVNLVAAGIFGMFERGWGTTRNKSGMSELVSCGIPVF